MPADYVRPYRKGGKNDASDAEAICEAVQRPGMRFVAVKTAEQQGVLALHRARALLRQVRRHMAAGRPSGLPWAERLLRRRPPNVVAVALANKLARQAWAVLHHGEPWRAQTA